MKTCVIIVDNITQPRCIKRIKSIISAGYNVKVYGFDGNLQPGNYKTIDFQIEQIYHWPEKGRVRINIFPYISILSILRHNGRDALYYIFGYHNAKIAVLLGCKNYIYEEADILASNFKNPIKRYAGLLMDKLIVKRSLLTIFTSEGFKKFLFGDKPMDNVLIVSNKLSPVFKTHHRPLPKENIDCNHINFGFVGLIRYSTIILFAKVIGRYFPNHSFHFFGDISGSTIIDDEFKNYNNVSFHGPFISPDDLDDIYSRIDVCISTYNPEKINVRIAEPNKLYESIYYCVPIVVSTGTFLSEKVESLNVGYSIDAKSEETIIAFIKSLSSDALLGISRTQYDICADDLIQENSSLLNRISAIINK